MTAFNILSLKANQEKSSILVTGGDNVRVRKVRQDLKDEPMKLHGVEVMLKDVYLGMVIH